MGVVEDRLTAIGNSVLVASIFKPFQHPRARNGRFIRKGGWVRGLFTFLHNDNFESKQAVGKVTGFSPNERDKKNPYVLITTRTGPAIARVSDIAEAAEPKGDLSTLINATLPPWMRGGVDDVLMAEERERRNQERLVKQIAEANRLAETLSETDAVERVKVLDKIMNGVRGTPLSTVYINNKRGKSGDEWDLVRMNQHEAIWHKILDRIEEAQIPKEKKALLLGGPPGAGKSYALRAGEVAGEFGVVGWDGLEPLPDGVNYFTLNPDSIKQMMIDEGMLPEGISDRIKPMEQVSFIHAESNFLTAMFFRRMSELGYNTVYDSTLSNVPHVKKNVGPLHDAGYTFKGVYISISDQESRVSAARRYQRDWELPMGGRYVPSEASGAWDTRHVFEKMTDWMDEWMIVDNTGVSDGTPLKKIIAQGTSPIVRPKYPVDIPIELTAVPGVVSMIDALMRRWPYVLKKIEVDNNLRTEMNQHAGARGFNGIILDGSLLDDATAAQRVEEFKGILVDPSPSGVVAHEFGHLLDKSLRRDVGGRGKPYKAARPDAKELLDAYLDEPIPHVDGKLTPRYMAGGRDEPSAYAMENRYEYVAEAISDVMKNGDSAKESSKFIARLFDEDFARRAEEEKKRWRRPSTWVMPPQTLGPVFDVVPKVPQLMTPADTGPGVYIPGKGIFTTVAAAGVDDTGFDLGLGLDWQAESLVRQGNAEAALSALRDGTVLPPSELGEEETDDELWAGKTSLFNDLYATGQYDLAPAFAETIAALRSGGVLAAFSEWQHPRAHDGKFIEVGKWVYGLFRYSDGTQHHSRGQVVSMDSSDMEHTGWVIHVDTPEGPAKAYPYNITQAADTKAHLHGEIPVSNPDLQPLDNLAAILSTAGVEMHPTMRETLNGIDHKLLWEPNSKTGGLWDPNSYTPGKPTPLMQAIEQAITAHGETLRAEVDSRLAAQGIVLLSPEEFKAREYEIKDAIEELQKSDTKASVDAEIKKLADKAKELEANRAIYRAAFAQAAQAVLKDRIPLGGAPKFALFKVNGNEPTADDYNGAEEWLTNRVGALYPSAWVEAHNNDLYNGTVSINVTPGRAYYNTQSKRMSIVSITDAELEGSKSGQQTAVHEFGHRMEAVVPALRLLEYAFYWRRVENEQPQQLRVLYQDPGFGPDEIARPDKFATAYMGRDYGGKTTSSWELFTMGMEILVSDTAQRGSRGINMVSDKDFQAWLLGTLATLGAVEG